METYHTARQNHTASLQKKNIKGKYFSNINKELIESALLPNSDVSKIQLFSHKKQNVSIKDDNHNNSGNLRLFENSKKILDRRTKRINESLYNVETNFKKQCTFSPQINDNSLLINLKKKIFSQNTSSEKHHIENDYREKSKLEKEEEFEKATARKRLVKSHLSPQRMEFYNRLYNDKISIDNIRKDVENEYYSKFRYTPTISNTSRPSSTNFFNRLERWNQKFSEKKNKIIEESMIDQKTRQVFFSPRISKMSEEIPKRKNIWIELYKEYNNLEVKKDETLQEKAYQILEHANSKTLTNSSEQIESNMMASIMKRLFENLDQDKDELISYNDFKEVLTERDNEYLIHVTKQVSNYETINLEQLIEIFNNVYMSISYPEKVKLKEWCLFYRAKFSPRKKYEIEDENKFHPKISQNTEDILKSSLRNSNNFMERNQALLNQQKKLIEEKKKKDEEISKECSFRPKISRYNGNRENGQKSRINN